MSEREQSAEPYETPEAEDVELVAGTGETAAGVGPVSVVRAI